MEERRTDHPRKEFYTTVYNHGVASKVKKVREASHEIHFYKDGKEIAWYFSKDDTLYIKSRYIKTPSSTPANYAEAIIGSTYESEYKELLGRYKNISEYI